MELNLSWKFRYQTSYLYCRRLLRRFNRRVIRPQYFEHHFDLIKKAEVLRLHKKLTRYKQKRTDAFNKNTTKKDKYSSNVIYLTERKKQIEDEIKKLESLNTEL